MSPLRYCNWGICKSWEYCCGDNVCCGGTDYKFLLLSAIILGTLIALFCTCFFCKPLRVSTPFIKKYLKISYVLMSTQRDNKGGTVVNQESTTEDYVVEPEKTKVSL